MFQFLVLLLIIALLFSFLGLLPFGPLDLMASTVVFVVVCWIANLTIAFLLRVPVNFESQFITALILALIFTPSHSFSLQGLSLQGVVAVIAMGSKYILAINKKHIFNPAAIAAAVAGWLGIGNASWWIGDQVMLPFVALGGFLIVKKIQRFDLVLSFLMVSILTSIVILLASGNNPIPALQNLLINSPLIFFATVMLVEPQTTPAGSKLRLLYGGLVAILSSYFSFETSLVAGNGIFYIIKPKRKMVLKFNQKIKAGSKIYFFRFQPDQKIEFVPGQYMEWTLKHPNPDDRGVRRYFTICSSPTEDFIGLATKFSEDQGSSFKKALLNLKVGDTLSADNIEGDFTLPTDPSQKLAFIAGGIGITPFKSMIKYLIDKNEMRAITLFYAAQEESEFVFKDLFEQAEDKLGIKTVYQTGTLNVETIKKELPDYQDRIFYLSGPHGMVEAYEKSLSEIGVPKSQIKTDYFPGYT